MLSHIWAGVLKGSSFTGFLLRSTLLFSAGKTSSMARDSARQSIDRGISETGLCWMVYPDLHEKSA